jgi:hypothetical protein
MGIRSTATTPMSTGMRVRVGGARSGVVELHSEGCGDLVSGEVVDLLVQMCARVTSGG